jgi:hypothetical protein
VKHHGTHGILSPPFSVEDKPYRSIPSLTTKKRPVSLRLMPTQVLRVGQPNLVRFLQAVLNLDHFSIRISDMDSVVPHEFHWIEQ